VTAGAGAGALALRLLPIDAELVSVAESGAAAFAERYGVRVRAFETLRSMALVPSGVHLAKHPRAAPFHLFLAVERATSEALGTCGFTFAPADRAVEIAYGTLPPFEGRGVAKAMAAELVAIARGSGAVDLVYAHTLCEPNASTRVLKHLGFRLAGEIVHPEDGPVWRWELPLGS
jgi:ribosomal-protein-alanine N-acetyltransferase